MKLLSLLVFVSVVAATAAFADPPAGSDPAHVAAAERYFATQNFSSDTTQAATSLANMIRNPSVTAEQRANFVQFAQTHIDLNAIKAAVVGAMAQTYTTDELNALADFYGSPVGKSAGAKTRAFQQAAAQATIPVSLGLLRTYIQQCTDKTKCLDFSAVMAPAPAHN